MFRLRFGLGGISKPAISETIAATGGVGLVRAELDLNPHPLLLRVRHPMPACLRMHCADMGRSVLRPYNSMLGGSQIRRQGYRSYQRLVEADVLEI